MTGLFSSETRRRIAIQPGELRIVRLAGAWFFFVLAGYSILRPLREQMGVAGGVRNLPWLFLCTLGVMLLAQPLYGRAVSKLPRGRFIPRVYRFFMGHLLVFFVVMVALPDDAQLWVGRAFFVWVSVFNLFVISVFWSFLAENFASARAKRLYAWIAVGGTLGSIAGSAVTWIVTRYVASDGGPLGEAALPWLLPLSILLLELAVRYSQRLAQALGAERSPERPVPDDARERALGGGALDGLVQVVRSPYLLKICLFLLCYSVTGTLLYFLQAGIVADFFDSRADRTQAFALIDLVTQLATLITQVFLTPRLIASAGIGRTLGVLPLTAAFAFLALAFAPAAYAFQVLVVAQVLRRSARYAVTKPAREVLFSVVERSEKYKAKAAIDTFVYRSGDVLGAGAQKVAEFLGMGLGSLAVAALPVTAGWALLALVLGRDQARRAGAQGDGTPAAD